MKKKISKQDLELNIIDLNAKLGSRIVPETHVCGPSHNTCEFVNTCDTTTTVQSETFCQTIANDGDCDQTGDCQTKDCTNVTCADSKSLAPICCPATQGNNCRETIDNCATRHECGNSKMICLETHDIHTVCQGMTQDLCLNPDPTIPISKDCAHTETCMDIA